MKTIFTFFSLLFVVNLNAQLVTISPTYQLPIFGDSINYVDANTFGFDQNGTGPVTAKVWDFSALMNTGSSIDFVYVDPATLTPADGKDSFPNASIARRESGAGGYFYYNNTMNSIDRIGAYVSPTNYMIYTGGTFATEFYFPITAGQSHNTTYKGNYSPWNVGEDSVRVTDGTLTMNADMQGQLSTPTGSFNSVLRIHVIESFHIKTYMFGMVAMDNIVSDDYYYWFNDTILQPIVTYGITTIDGTAQTPVLRYQPISTPTNITNNTLSNVSVFPNPSNGLLFVKSNQNIEKLELTSLSGQNIITNNINNNNAVINTKNYKAGSYLLNIYYKNKIETKTIVIK